MSVWQRAMDIPVVFHKGLAPSKDELPVKDRRFIAEGFLGVKVDQDAMDAACAESGDENPFLMAHEDFWYYWNWNHKWAFSLINGDMIIALDEGPFLLGTATWEIM